MSSSRPLRAQLVVGDAEHHVISFQDYGGERILHWSGTGSQPVMKVVGSYQPNVLYHFSIDFAPELGLWIGKINGQECWREPYTGAAYPGLTFYHFNQVTSQYYRQAYVDNIVISDATLNQAPSFTKGPDVISPEDTPFSQAWATDISAGPNEDWQSVIFEVTTDHPELFSVAPAISRTGVLSFAPAPQLSGHANVTVRLFDTGGTANGGVNVSAPQTFAIDVTSVDDPPTLDSLPNRTLLNNAGEQVVSLTGISAGPAGETANLQVTATSSDPALIPTPTVYYSSPDATGTLKFTPSAGASGMATVTVTVTEVDSPGVRFSRSFNVNVTSLPSFAKGPDVHANEDAKYSYPGWASEIAIGAGSPTDPLSFEVTTDNPALFAAIPTISPAGQLDFAGAPDANGHASVTVRLHVGSLVSDPRSFTVDLKPVPDKPTISVASSATFYNDGLEKEIAMTGIASGPADETETVTVHALFDNTTGAPVQSVTAVYTYPNTTGNIKVALKPGAHGQALITVKCSKTVATPTDPESPTKVYETDAKIVVNVLDELPSVAPTFTPGANVNTTMGSGDYSQTWATTIKDSHGEANPADLEFVVTNDAPALFSAPPSIDSQGALTFRPAGDDAGLVHVSVFLRDNSRPAESPYRESAATTFAISILPHDPPSFTPGDVLTVSTSAGPQNLQSWATQIQFGPATEPPTNARLIVTVDHPEFFTVQPALSLGGQLIFAPAPTAIGTAVVTIVLDDGDGVQSAPITRQIHIGRSNFVGSYRALVQAPLPLLPSDGSPITVPVTHHSEAGLLTLTANATGRFTGRILLHGAYTRAFSGRFDGEGRAVFLPGNTATLVVDNRNSFPLSLQLTVQASDPNQALTGTLTHVDAVYASISGGLAPFVATRNPRAPFRALPATRAGRYTMAFQPEAASESNPTPVYPRGSGFATVSVNCAGLVAFSGRLPDETPINYSGPMLGDLSVPVYIRTFGGRGSLSGFLHFRDEAESDIDSEDFHWSSPGSRAHPAAWDGVPVSVQGAKYTGAGFSGKMPATQVDYTVAFEFNSGALQLAPVPVLISRGVIPRSSSSDLAIAINPATGLFRGTYKNPNTHVREPFFGAILSKQSTAYGYIRDGQPCEVTIVPTTPQP